jgi:hypothetical protein
MELAMKDLLALQLSTEQSRVDLSCKSHPRPLQVVDHQASGEKALGKK